MKGKSLKSIEVKIDSLKSVIKNRTNIEIYNDTLVSMFKSGDYLISNHKNKQDVLDKIKKVDSILKRYPIEFLKNLNLKSISVVENLSGRKKDGSFSDTVEGVNGGGDILLESVDFAFTHEIGHSMDSFMGNLSNDKEWLERSYKNKMVRSDDFISTYAETSVTEDQAEMAGALMDLIDIPSNTSLLEKERIIKEWYLNISKGLMDEKYWEDAKNGVEINEKYWEKKREAKKRISQNSKTILWKDAFNSYNKGLS